MSRKSLFIIFAVIVLVPGSAFAQNPKETPKKEESIEELYLSNPGLRIAYEAARSEERESKLLAISQINELIDQGLSSADEGACCEGDSTAQGALSAARAYTEPGSWARLIACGEGKTDSLRAIDARARIT